MVQWNDTQSPCDTNRCIHWLFEDEAAAFPDSIAVDDGQSVMSYAQLNERANRIAHHLSSVGVSRGSLVGLCMDRSVDLIAAVLGILKSGAAYVPMEPALPDQRIAYIVDTLKIAILIDPNQIKRAEELAFRKCQPLTVISIHNGEIGRLEPTGAIQLAGLPTSNPERIAKADDRAYIIFTSGSSGDPKAVIIRHRSVINLIEWVNKTFKVGREDKVLFTTSIAFDLSVYDIFGILAAGGTIRIATTAELRDPQRLANLLYLERITFWDSAPAAMERLCPFLKKATAVNRLRLLFLSGDWIPLALPPRTKEAFPTCRVVALGGATEATIWSNFHEIHAIDPAWNSIPYGRPIQNVRYYILDTDLEPCPIGTAGELYIGGQCVADGYANDPELTARKFIPNPFVQGDRLYRTGDRARYKGDGTIELIGRMDRQIKVQGVRIEPGEIEAVLRQHPKVERALVLADGEPRASKRLLACIVSPDSAENSEIIIELKALLRRTLPEQMMPARFVVVSELPITLNGKIDATALLLSLDVGKQQLSEDDLPCSEAEKLLVTLWCRILHLPQVGINESFFDLGGDSLQIVAMVTAAAGMGLRLRFDELHQHPTIKQLAALAANRFNGSQPIGSEGEIPLTPTQRWFFERSLKFPGRYNEAFVFDLSLSTDIDSLRQALLAVQARHDALRLRFDFIDGQWAQQCDAVIEPDVDKWDMSSLDEESYRENMGRRVAALRREMNLHGGTLLKAVLIDRGPRRPAQLLLVLHHLIFDAVSLGVIIEDLSTAIAQIARGQRIRLPGAGSFSTWARRLHTHSKSPEVAGQLAYWLNLPWHQATALPKDYPDAPNTYATSRTSRAELSKLETTQLKRDVPGYFGASMGTILLAMCLRTLTRWANHTTVLIDLTDHGRREIFNDLSVARTVGYVTSNTPIVITLPPSTTSAQAVSIVERHLDQMPQQGSGFGLLRYLTPLDEAIARLRPLPRAELKFNYVGSVLSDALGSQAMHLVPATYPGVLDPEDHRAYLHNLELFIADGRLQVEWKYSAAAHRTQSIEALLEDYLAALREIIANVRDHHPVGGQR